MTAVDILAIISASFMLIGLGGWTTAIALGVCKNNYTEKILKLRRIFILIGGLATILMFALFSITLGISNAKAETKVEYNIFWCVLMFVIFAPVTLLLTITTYKKTK